MPPKTCRLCVTNYFCHRVPPPPPRRTRLGRVCRPPVLESVALAAQRPPSSTRLPSLKICHFSHFLVGASSRGRAHCRSRPLATDSPIDLKITDLAILFAGETFNANASSYPGPFYQYPCSH